MKRPWSVSFDLRNIKSEDDFFVVYCLKIKFSKHRQCYIGSCIISLKQFYSNNTYNSGTISVNLSTLPIDFCQFKTSSIIFDNKINLPKPHILVTLFYNTKTGMLEVGNSALYWNMSMGISQRGNFMCIYIYLYINRKTTFYRRNFASRLFASKIFIIR